MIDWPNALDPTPLAVDCVWCGVPLQLGREPVSHGICPLCMANELGISIEALQAERAKQASR